jgi:hypothetical protein
VVDNVPVANQKTATTTVSISIERDNNPPTMSDKMNIIPEKAAVGSTAIAMRASDQDLKVKTFIFHCLAK